MSPPPIPLPPPPPMPDGSKNSIFRASFLPQYLRSKKNFRADVLMKKVNWKTIMPQKISEQSFWATCKEEELASDDVFNILAAQFPMKSSKNVIGKSFETKKVVLHVLEHNQAQNILISLGTLLKCQSHDQFRQSILRCDTSVLNLNIVQQLIKYLPSSNQLKKLKQIKEAGNELAEVEQLVVTLGEIQNLMPRLHCINFKLTVVEMLTDIQPDIVNGIAACEEIRKSKKFAKILELILLFGNYLNSSSSTTDQAFGFEISSLKNLQDTKDSNNKRTLLHCIVETIEKKFPELINFGEELLHVDMAARISLENIRDTIRQLTDSLDILNTTLKDSAVPQSPDDKFIEVMNDLSIQYADQIRKMNELKNTLENQFKELGEYFTFCIHECPIEAFFSDIKNFKDSFTKAYEDNKRNTVAGEQQRNFQKGYRDMKSVLDKIHSNSKEEEKRRSAKSKNQSKPSKPFYTNGVDKISDFCRDCFIKLDRIKEPELKRKRNDSCHDESKPTTKKSRSDYKE